MHMLRTEHAFIERKFELQYAHSYDADDGEVDEQELEFEFFWAFNNRMAVVFELPVIFLDPDDASQETGVGDLEIGFRFVTYNSRNALVTLGLNVVTPTGDDSRDLGSGHAAIEPVLLALYDFGGGTVMQSEFAWEIPLDVDEPENEFIFNIGLGHTLLSTSNWCYFRNVTPLIELNGVTSLNGDASGETVLDITPGVTWNFGRSSELGVSYSEPLTGDRAFDRQFRIGYFRHF